jgi:alkylation response protein AidB-like acyl-CoA dehydrogenase
MRKFVDDEIIPNIEDWEAANSIPAEYFKKASAVGLLPAMASWPEDISGIPPRPRDYDLFFSFIAYDELSRCASGGTVWGLVGGMGIGLPPLVHAGTPEMKRNIVGPVVRGEKRIALCVSEPQAGSDVQNLQTTAIKDGDSYIVNGLKKWITCGTFADFFTVAVQTQPGSGFGGIQLLVIERSRKGVSTRAMDCMGVKGSGTAYVEFEDVRVPSANMLPGGAALLISNFSMERLGIAAQANRFARECVRLSLEHAHKRPAFKGTLLDLPVVKAKIIEMARKVESTHAYMEQLMYRMVMSEKKGEDVFAQLMSLSAEASMAKVMASKTFEECARSAAHIFGGNSYVKGNRIEHLYRQVISLAIPGGAEDVMIDYAARLSFQGKL